MGGYQITRPSYDRCRLMWLTVSKLTTTRIDIGTAAYRITIMVAYPMRNLLIIYPMPPHTDNVTVLAATIILMSTIACVAVVIGSAIGRARTVKTKREREYRNEKK
jgi:hypothetical protein